MASPSKRWLIVILYPIIKLTKLIYDNYFGTFQRKGSCNEVKQIALQPIQF